MQKTRTALLQAFNALVLERRYADIRVGDLIRRANVGRSTFYEHFRNKNDVLRQSLSGILAVLADAVADDCDIKKLRFILDHFRENSRLALSLLNGPASAHVVAVYVGLVEQRLAILQPNAPSGPVLPLRLVAAQIAGGQLGVVRAWLTGGSRWTTAEVATAIRDGSIAVTRSLLGGPHASVEPRRINEQAK